MYCINTAKLNKWDCTKKNVYSKTSWPDDCNWTPGLVRLVLKKQVHHADMCFPFIFFLM